MADFYSQLQVVSGLAVGIPLGWLLCLVFVPRRKAEPYSQRPYVVFELAPALPAAPVLVEHEPGSYIRFSWARLNRKQWLALWHTTATAELAGEGKPFSRAEVEGIRDLLIRRGVASWRNPASRSQGWTISEPMRRAIIAYLGGVPHREGEDVQARADKAVLARVHAKNEEEEWTLK